MEAGTIVALILLIGLVWMLQHTRLDRDAHKKKLEDLTKKTQMEMELDLATTEQLMDELTKRSPCILVVPLPPKVQNTLPLNVSVFNMPRDVAMQYITMAAHVIANHHDGGGNNYDGE